MTRLDLDLSHIDQWVACLFDPDDLVEVRCIRGRGGDARSSWVTAAAVRGLAEEELQGLNADGWNVYVGANPRKRHGGKSSDDVAVFRTVFVDWDGITPATAQRIVEAAGVLHPTMTVATGHGVHAYWRLDDPIADPEAWASYQRALIAALNSDPTIKDPPRIMRAPGFLNVKAEPYVPCRVLHFDPDQVASLDDLGVEPLEAPPAPQIGEAFVVGDHSEPHPATVAFATRGDTGKRDASGQIDGRRGAIFAAACDLCGRGYAEDEATRYLWPGVTRCGLDARYAEAAIRSAFSKVREPRVSLDELLDFDMLADRVTHGTEAEHEAAAERGEARRPVVATYVEQTVPGGTDARGRAKADRTIAVALPLPKVLDTVKDVMGGWPRVTDGLLFTFDGEVDGLPHPGGLRFLDSHDALTAWIQETAWIRFGEGRRMVGPDGEPASCVTRAELFRALRDSRREDHRYSAVELLPHEPPVPGVFYVQPKLPEGHGDALREFLALLNPATEIDRRKMLAAILTLFWGGPPGKRPAFVFTAPTGRGSGKTSSARAISAIAGGAITMLEGEDPEQFLQRLFSDSSMSLRVALIDNLKRSLDSGSLEGWITGETIQGKRLYHGGIRRPNLLTWIVTANTPTLSQDLAQRAVVIGIGAPKRGAVDFDAAVLDFMAARRDELVADVLEILRRDPVCEITHRDRWGLWQDAVLSRIEDGDEVAAAIIADRPSVDADLEVAEQIAEALDAVVAFAGYIPEGTIASIPLGDVATALRWEELSDRAAPTRRVIAWLMHQRDVGPLRGRLERDPSHKAGKRILWRGTGADPDDPVRGVEVTIAEPEWRERRRLAAREEFDAAAGGDPDTVGGLPV